MFLVSALWMTTGCSSSDACRSLLIGTDISSFDKAHVLSSNEPVYRAMLSRAVDSHGDPSIVWNRGPAEHAMCCATQANGEARQWCTTEELECSDASMQGLELYILWGPYSDLSREPDDATFCYVATKENRVVAFWHRYWS